jgi:NarL family two-component system response regulator LiaR
VRQSLRIFLELDPELEVVGEAADGREAVHLAHRLRPDVVLMDLVIPELDGVAATRVIRRELPDTEVVALSSVLSDPSGIGAWRAGAIGYFLKNTKSQGLRQAIKSAAAGEVQLSPETATRLLCELGAPEQRRCYRHGSWKCCDCWRRAAPSPRSPERSRSTRLR